MSLLGFHLIANERGDGLHPALRELLESRHAIEADARIVDLASSRTGSMSQAGPNPIAQGGGFCPGNVVGFRGKEKQAALDAQSTNGIKGKA